MHIEINYYNFTRIYSTQRQIINIAHWFPVNTGRLLDIHNAQKMYLGCFEVGLCTLGLLQNTWNTNDYHQLHNYRHKFLLSNSLNSVNRTMNVQSQIIKNTSKQIINFTRNPYDNIWTAQISHGPIW